MGLNQEYKVFKRKTFSDMYSDTLNVSISKQLS